MKKSFIHKIIHSKLTKRLISGLTAIAVISCAVPICELSDGLNDIGLSFFSSAFLNVSAATEHEYSHADDATNDYTIRIPIRNLVYYSVDCENDRAYHQNDNLIITSEGDTTVLSAGFRGLQLVSG